MLAGARIAVVGATGAVGREMLKVLEEREFPVNSLVCLADPREAGTRLSFKGEEIVVEGAGPDKFKGIDIAFFAVGGEVKKNQPRPAPAR